MAHRILAIPANIDVLLCEQEVKADETPAVQAVMRSDLKRVKLEDEVWYIITVFCMGKNKFLLGCSKGPQLEIKLNSQIIAVEEAGSWNGSR